MDTHADTTVLGSNCVVLSYTGKECEVSPYSSQYEAVWNVPVVTGATVWTNAADGMAYLLIFHESLWMGDKLDHTLVNPNQLPAYGVNVQDNPFDAKPLSITTDDASVELYSEGTIICGDTRTPTEPELRQLPQLILTSHMTGIPTTSASHLTIVSHLAVYQSSLITQYLQWTHCCNTRFMIPLWWHHSCHHMSRSRHPINTNIPIEGTPFQCYPFRP